MADTDFITRHDAQVEYCKLCGICKTPGKKENVENACIQSFPAKNQILEIPAADVRPVVRAFWVGEKDGIGICSNCKRLDHIDPLATHCRYCGADMRETGR